MDGATLTEALHQRGINVRYLGSVLEFVDKTPAKAQLEHFYVSVKTVMIVLGLLVPRLQTDILLFRFYSSQRIGISELITRCAKHIFKTYLQVSNVLVIDWVVFFFFCFVWKVICKLLLSVFSCIESQANLRFKSFACLASESVHQAPFWIFIISLFEKCEILL